MLSWLVHPKINIKDIKTAGKAEEYCKVDLDVINISVNYSIVMPAPPEVLHCLFPVGLPSACSLTF
jgi:hypothetical protein